MEKISAIVLAAGQGKRMNTTKAKQYLDLLGKPVLYYSLKVFQDSEVDEIVLVVGNEDEAYCRREIVDKYGFSKVKTIVSGGEERYLSVYKGLMMAESCDYILVHDGARPFINQDIVQRVIKGVREFSACIVAVPSKDTIKLVDQEGIVRNTPERKYVYNVQTPQAFSYKLLKEAYEKALKCKDLVITDDAMVVEAFTESSIHIIEGSYQNIKITTPEDLIVAEAFAGKMYK